ncbi:MAG: hypothetical protein ACR2MT_06810 [Aurantibacter sp.]
MKVLTCQGEVSASWRAEGFASDGREVEKNHNNYLSPMTSILLIHIFSTFFMCGLCWFVQIVHYPLFKAVPLHNFPAYQKKNYVTGHVTVPMMTVELFSGLWVLFAAYSDLFLTNMILLAIIWGSTFVFQVPIHLQLAKNPTHKLMSRLIRTNWIRTLSWTMRSGILAYLLLNN